MWTRPYDPAPRTRPNTKSACLYSILVGVVRFADVSLRSEVLFDRAERLVFPEMDGREVVEEVPSEAVGRRIRRRVPALFWTRGLCK